MSLEGIEAAVDSTNFYERVVLAWQQRESNPR
jgi:hypothetical protein